MKYRFFFNKAKSKKPYRVISEKVINPIFHEIPTGSYEVEFNGSGLPSGIYFYKLEAGGNRLTKKLLLLK